MVIKHKTQEQKIHSEFENFLADNKHRFKTEKNLELLRKAFKFAYKAHKGSVRYNGEPYINHPLEVAKIVSEQIGLGTTSATSALLHDIPNKTEYNTEDIKRYFGEKIYSIISSLKKIKNTEYFENNAQASILRQILLSISDDIRVIFIKIADKLHNIRNVDDLPTEKQKKSVEDILNIYAPLAHRLGLYDIKAEMEDICLKNTNPYIYHQISKRLQSSEKERIQFINSFVQPIKEKLESKNIKYEISGRSKSNFSIWKKMQRKGVPIEEIYDLFAVRIIFKAENKENENFEALQIGTLITDLYREKKDRKRNWLKNGKDTGYRALHVTVMSDDGRWVEVQIRSEEMHEVAEYGLATHWKYKGLKEKKTEFDEKIRDILEYLSEDNSSALTFIDNLKLNLFTSEIYVFTPKGDIINLPKESSVLDFAFKIHTDIAMKSIAGKINGKPQPLSTKLKNGDQIEILTTKKQQAQKEWFDFVITQRALSKLRKIFKEDIEKNIETGKNKLESILLEKETDNIGKCIDNISKHLGYSKKEKLFEDIGEEKISDIIISDTIKKFCIKQRSTRFWKIKRPFKSPDKDAVLPELYKLAKCCNPYPGNEIIGTKSDDKTITIHKINCSSAMTEIAFKHNNIDVSWTSYTAISVLKEFNISGFNQPEVINKITGIISKDISVNIKTFNFETKGTNFLINIKLYVKEEENSINLYEKLSKLPFTTDIEILN